MDFRILGPLEVIEDGQALDLGGQKQRALLAALLIEANRVVSSDRLIDALWPEQPPETAAKAVQVYVSQLRKTLGRDRVETRTPGYLIRVKEGELDLERCGRLVEEGKVREALSLWRGLALSDFAYEPFAQGEIARLAELRLACLEERIELDLHAGRQAALVGELEALVQDHPLRERFRAQLMLALYRSGRQAEALEVYQAGRGTLADELGLEPGEALKSLQRAILEHDPILGLPARETEGAEADTAPAAPPPASSEERETRETRETRKTVTVLFAQLVTTDGTERLDPEAQRRITSRAFAEISSAVERHGGTVETLAGDAVTAIFGVPTVYEDDALRATRAAVQIRESLAALAASLASERRLQLSFRIGISTGEVVTGGEAANQLRTTGEPLMLASRLAGAGTSLGPTRRRIASCERR